MPDFLQHIFGFFSRIRVMPRTRAKWMIFGSLIALLGYVLPWYMIKFSPPGGSMVINGVTIDASFVARNGPQQANYVASLGHTISVVFIHSIPVSMGIVFLVGVTMYYLAILRPNITTSTIFIRGIRIGNIIPLLGYIYSFILTLFSGTITIDAMFTKALGGRANVEKMLVYVNLYIEIGILILALGLIIAGVGIYLREKPKEEIEMRVAAGAMKKMGCLDNIALTISAFALAVFLATLITTPIFNSFGANSPLASLDAFMWSALHTLFF